MNWDEIVYYDSESPSGLRWKTDRWGGKYMRIKAAEKDGVAGSVSGSNNPYWRINLKGAIYKAHRIVWQLHNGEISDGQVIDHIDGDVCNNRIENLRCVVQKQNSRNLSMRICNKSGISGVYKRDDGTEKARWVAQVTGLETYKKYSKSFSVSKYGNEEALRLACLWKESKLSELNEQGAGFTERHGKPQLNSD